MLLEKLSIHAWINSNAIKTESGQVLDFHNHRYLFDIYRDNSPLLCCTKAGQIGFSTMAILKTIWLAYNKRMRIGYVLPTADMSQKFVSSKVNPISQQNRVIASWMKDKDAVEQKQIGQGFIHFVGAQTPTAAIMLTMDMLILDEYDKARQDILEMFNSRLQHSIYKWKWIFSNPTIPDFGVDRFWQISDQKKWHIKHSCKEIYVLDESCIDYEAEIFRCPKCKGEINDENRRMGEWVATANGEWSGYWIPLWINPNMSAKEICGYKANSTREYFYNFVAGLPYINTADMLSQKMLESNLINKVNSQEDRVIIGIDTGNNLHYVLANKDGIFFHGYCQSVEENYKGERKPNYNPWNEIDDLMKRFPRSIAMVDQGGDLIGSQLLREKYRGRVFLVMSNKVSKTAQTSKWGENDEDGKVSIDRNRTVQMLVEEIKDQRFPIWGTVEEWQPYFDQCLNIYRVKEIKGEESDPQYNWQYVWKRKGPDHWWMATVYARVGLEKFGQDLAQIIKPNAMLKGIPRAFQGSITTPDVAFLGEEVIDL